MKKIFLFLIFPLFILPASAQDEPETLHKTARNFMAQADWNNAILVLNRLAQTDMKNLEYQKDLIQCFYYKRDFEKAIEGIKTVIGRDDADVMTFQLAGNVYKAIEDPKECEKVYKAGLKKFPRSGPLYSEYGELLWARKDYSAIDLWEKGIETDPAFSGNYYNAATYYFFTDDKIWSLIYGEIFVNMESLSPRGAAMKELVMKAYKEKLFINPDLVKGEENNKSAFARAYLETMNKLTPLVSKGVTTEVLIMIRARFILDWFEHYAARFPHRLFDFHQQLMKEGLFEAYNQWLFGTVENLTAFDQWTKKNESEYKDFTAFQRSRVFRVPQGQYYHVK